MDSKEEQLIDNEIFFGKLSLREIKLMFAPNQTQRQTIAASELAKEDDCNMSLQLISTQSEPDINKGKGILNSPETITLSNVTLSPNGPNLYENLEVTSSENSFLKDEKLTEESCEATSKECLDNTLEAIEKILNSSPKDIPQNVAANFNFGSNDQITPSKYKITPSKVNNAYTNQQSTEKCLKSVSSPAFTPVKHEKNIKEVFATPSSVLRSKPSLLKTPANVQLFKKPSTSSIKKTPSRNDAFKHIASPVAYYINNSPQVPLVLNVKPRKHLTGIPKLVKSSAVKSGNKENINLPAMAYKSAKKTTVVDISNGPKLPQSVWARKLTDSLPRPAVIKHSHREMAFRYNKSLGRRQEDSIGDLSVHEADVSVCTKKSAY